MKTSCRAREAEAHNKKQTDKEMEQIYIEGKTFDRNNYTTSPLIKGEYENCAFKNCDFYNSDLSEIKFIDCMFIDCNLSLTKLTKTAFRDIKFKDSKMLGMRFEDCNPFGFSFSIDNCNLNHSTFYKTKLKKTNFKNAQLQETDFTECDLTAFVFDNCDLTRATFYNTIIEKSDFRTSYNYSIDPEVNRIKKAKFSLYGVTGLLEKYDIEIDQSV